MSASDPRQTAVEFLLATRRADTDEIERLARRLSNLDEVRLSQELDDDRSRRAFWIDLYNAIVQQQPVPDFASWVTRTRFFRRPLISVAGRALSLDDIEHGILRRSRLKVGLGYAPNPRPSGFERRHRVGAVDPRIHFALNCAAASCPPIAAYQAPYVDGQLDLATRSYLAGSVTRDDDGISMPAVFLWFIGDFGGPPGVRHFLRVHGVRGWGDPIRFAAWDWTPAPGSWAAEAEPDSGSA